jgi:hypothetical protein
MLYGTWSIASMPAAGKRAEAKAQGLRHYQSETLCPKGISLMVEQKGSVNRE